MIKSIVVAILSLFASTSQGQSSEVESRVNELKVLMIDPQEKKLNNLLCAKLSYGHSSGKIDTRDSFIRGLMSGESDFVEIEIKDLAIEVSGNVAIARHQLI
jgi:hypothetical protein